MRKQDKSGFFALQLLGDSLLAVVSIVIAFHLRYQVIAQRNWEPFLQISWILFGLAMLLFYFFRSYRCGERARLDCMYESWIVFLVMAIFTMAITYLTRGFAYPRSVIAISFFVQSILIVLWKQVMFWLHQKFYHGKMILVFGEREENERILHKLWEANKTGNIRIFVHEVNEVTLSFLDEADEVVITAFPHKNEVMRLCMQKGIPIAILPTLHEVNLLATELKHYDDIPLLATKPFGLTKVQDFQKRIFDILVSGISLVILAPIFIGTALAVLWDDGFPVIYKQTRLTKGDKPFTLYKFRTMIKDAEKATGPILAEDADPRITNLGRLLRKTRLDELPQLMNVFLGQMSMVGPRPERPHFVQEYIQAVPEFRFRTRVKAGVTGLGQILGKYTTSPNDKLIFDMIYIRNYSLLMDIKLCVQTVRILASKTSAAGVKNKQVDRSLEDVYKIQEGKGYFSVNGERS